MNINRKKITNTIIIIGIVIFAGLTGYFIINWQTPAPISNTDKCDIEPDINGKCPIGCVNYGIPLGCVTQEYYDECQNRPCPICLAGDTLINTPSGPIPIKNLQIDMPIWTTDNSGQRVSGIIIKTSKTPTSPTHQMVHLILDDGRKLFSSPGHPIVDGRVIGDLIVGDFYNDARVISANQVPYNDTATYDILPSGTTGFYWANDILIDSALQ